MFSEQPRLKLAYEIKEGMFDIYKATTRREAEQRYIEWRKAMPLSMKKRFNSLPHAMKDKSQFIMNYFDYPYTNAYIESLNRQIGDMNRDGRGYSFDTLRAKSLVAHGADFRSVSKFERVRFGKPEIDDVRNAWKPPVLTVCQVAAICGWDQDPEWREMTPEEISQNLESILREALSNIQPANMILSKPGEVREARAQLEDDDENLYDF